MVYYRKYRPQTLDEIMGQDHIKQTLLKAYQSQQLAHAYLFYGPKGTGKTSTARILAKMVNCEKGGCNKCPICLSITDGSNLDLIEIDAASNRGIDDIRSLRETIKLSPTLAKKKVYIIDEVHMLTTEAFNALLKTLEEPPEHVLFILATTEVSKIPQTILSRVQKLDFKSASIDDLIKATQRIVETEGISVEMEALRLIAKKSEGSFRDCQKLLDQLASRGEKITVSLVEDLLDGGGFEDSLLLLEALVKKDTMLALEQVNKQIEEGVNIKELILSSLDILRAALLISYGAAHKIKEELGSQKYESVNLLAEQFSSKKLVKIIEIFLTALEKMKITSVPSLPLEIAVVESCDQPSDYPVAIPAPAQGWLSSEQKVISANSETLASDKKTQTVIDDISTPDMVIVKDKWNYVLETIKPYNYSLEALLKQVKILSCNEGMLVLEVPYSFHQRILEAPKSKDLLESVLADVLTKSVKVTCVLGNRPVRVEELANVELAADDEVIRVAAEIFNS